MLVDSQFCNKLQCRDSGFVQSLESQPLSGLVLVVANDSGPMHLAEAAGAAVVEISCHPTGGDSLHSNSPVRFHPWVKEYVVFPPPQAREPCTSSCECHEAHCILGVSVEVVQEAARTLLARGLGSSQTERRSRPGALTGKVRF